MLKNIALGFLALSIVIPALASAKGDPSRCAERVREAGCALSNNDLRRIRENVSDCKQVNGKNGDRLEIFQLIEAGKVVVVNTNHRGGQYCPTTKYTIDNAGINSMKIITGTTFLLSNAGRVYFMLSDEEVYEVLNARGRSYSNVTEIKGDNGGTAIRLIGPGFNNLVTMSDLNEKAYRGQLRKINFFRSTTGRSIFRDE